MVIIIQTIKAGDNNNMEIIKVGGNRIKVGGNKIKVGGNKIKGGEYRIKTKDGVSKIKDGETIWDSSGTEANGEIT